MLDLELTIGPSRIVFLLTRPAVFHEMEKEARRMATLCISQIRKVSNFVLLLKCIVRRVTFSKKV